MRRPAASHPGAAGRATGGGDFLRQSLGDGPRLFAIVFLVFANGFFVAAEFALVAVRRSRVQELVAEKRAHAGALQRAVDSLDSHLAATQLGITISSLALGWVGEPALAHLIEPLLAFLPQGASTAGAHAVAVVFSFVVITSLHIVLGELAPKSLALQRSERTALAIVRPLRLFLLVFRPAISFLNGLGNGVLRLCGLQPAPARARCTPPPNCRCCRGQPGGRPDPGGAAGGGAAHLRHRERRCGTS